MVMPLVADGRINTASLPELDDPIESILRYSTAIQDRFEVVIDSVHRTVLLQF